jgi:glutathione S-transferase
MDYLEAKYPKPAMLPTDAKALATVRMVEMVTVNELLSVMHPLLRQMVGLTPDDPLKLEQAKQQTAKVLTFFERLLGDHPYFGGDSLTLAEIVAGTAVPLYPILGVPLDDYPKLSAWSKRLMERDTWQKTQPSPEEIEALKSQLREQMTQQSTH